MPGFVNGCPPTSRIMPTVDREKMFLRLEAILADMGAALTEAGWNESERGAVDFAIRVAITDIIKARIRR